MFTGREMGRYKHYIKRSAVGCSKTKEMDSVIPPPTIGLVGRSAFDGFRSKLGRVHLVFFLRPVLSIATGLMLGAEY